MNKVRAVPKSDILIVVSTMGQFPEMFRIASMLKATNLYRPIIYFNLSTYSGHPNVSLCLNNGIDVLDYRFGFIESSLVAQSNETASKFINKQELKIQIQNGPNLTLKNFIKYKMPNIFEFIKKVVYYVNSNLHLLGVLYRIAVKLKRYKRENAFFDNFNLKVIVLAEDSEHYYTPQLIRYGKKRGVRSVVFPYTFANQFEFLQDAYFNDRRVDGSLFNRVAGFLFPKWTMEFKGKKLLKADASFVFTSEMFGDSAPNPWIMSSGYSDVIAVESEFMKDYYKAAGIPEMQMQTTGYPSLDSLYSTYKNRDHHRDVLSKKINIDSTKPWVTCAVPPSQWPRAGVGFKSYDEFLERFITYFAKFENIEVLFKFHPRLGSHEIKSICDKFNIAYIEEDTADLIALSDMYVASSSSTIRWALAVGLPTLNYDMYNYEYNDFDSGSNYQTVVKFEDFQVMFQKVVASLNTYRNENEFQSKFGLLDGKASDRIVALFEKLQDK